MNIFMWHTFPIFILFPYILLFCCCVLLCSLYSSCSRKSHLLFIHSSSVSLSLFFHIYILFHFRLALYFSPLTFPFRIVLVISVHSMRRWSTTKTRWKSVAAENGCKLYLYFYDFICCQLSRRVCVCAQHFLNDACFVRDERSLFAWSHTICVWM